MGRITVVKKWNSVLPYWEILPSGYTKDKHSLILIVISCGQGGVYKKGGGGVHVFPGGDP